MVQGKKKVEPDNADTYVNDLNRFFARFNTYNFKEECEQLVARIRSRSGERIVITRADVIHSLRFIKIGKACGPDMVIAKVIKSCMEQIVNPLLVLFQDSIDQGIVPTLWKMSEIIPVPKTKFPKELNDLRPVTLTSFLMKSLERIVKQYLCSDVHLLRDPLQFACCENKSV